MRPNILDRNFKYVPAAKTDVRKTFRAAQRRIDEQRAKDEQQVKQQVIQMKMRK